MRKKRALFISSDGFQREANVIFDSTFIEVRFPIRICVRCIRPCTDTGHYTVPTTDGDLQ